MIMSVTELRQYITSDATDQALEAQLSALELSIRSYTNNNFQVRTFRSVADAYSEGKQLIVTGSGSFAVGDTLQISGSDFNDGLVTVTDVDGSTITVAENLYDESYLTITKVVYPADVKMGAVNLMKWEMSSRDKVGIASESISRHSVTYSSPDGDNYTIGYPRALTGFLKPYKKARFGRGLSV